MHKHHYSDHSDVEDKLQFYPNLVLQKTRRHIVWHN